MGLPSKASGEVTLRTLLPREHGAWGLLLQPFAAAVAIAGTWSWSYLPVLGVVLLGFLVREPLVIWIRHRFLWKKETDARKAAGQWALLLLAGAAVCAAALAAALPWQPLALFFGAGLLLSVCSIWLTLRNQQRSMTLQMVSAAGLTSSALLVALAATGTFPDWAWQLWAVLTAHAVAAIPAVHARLQFKARKPSAPATYRLAALLQALLVAAACFLVLMGSRLWIPVAFSALANGFEVWRLRQPGQLDEPIKRLGLRLLASSVIQTILAALVVG